MTAPDKPVRDMTDEEIYVRNAQRQYDVVAEKLEAVARRMRQQGEWLKTRKGSAVGQAADAISECTQGVGNIGAHLWGLVHDAEHLDRFRREQAAGQDRKAATQ